MDPNDSVLHGRFIIKDKDALCKALNITNLSLLKSGLQFIIPKSEVFKLFRNSFQVTRNTSIYQNNVENGEEEVPSKKKPCKTVNDISINKKSLSAKNVCYKNNKTVNDSDKKRLKWTQKNIDSHWPMVKINRCDETKKQNLAGIKYSSKNVKHISKSSNISIRPSLYKKDQPFINRRPTELNASGKMNKLIKSGKLHNNRLNIKKKKQKLYSTGNKTFNKNGLNKIKPKNSLKHITPKTKIKKCENFMQSSFSSGKKLIKEYKADQDITFRNYFQIDSNPSKTESLAKRKKTVKTPSRTEHSLYESNLMQQSSLIGKLRSEDSHLLLRHGRLHKGSMNQTS